MNEKSKHCHEIKTKQINILYLDTNNFQESVPVAEVLRQALGNRNGSHGTLGWDFMNEGPVSRYTLWHDKEPSLLNGWRM